MKINDFKLGAVYNRNDLIDAFGGSFMGGMNICKKTNSLVLISKHTANRIYGDQFRNDLIIYTGQGQKGDQSIRSGNKKLLNAEKDGTSVYLFVVFKPQQYTYYGLVELFGNYYFEKEKDVDEKERNVIRFPLRRLTMFPRPITPSEKREIRVGSTHHILPTYNVVGAAIIKDNTVLCAQRGYGSLKGKWEFPGGKIEKEETNEQALKREIKEELNIEIDVNEMIGCSSYQYPDMRVNLTVYKCKFVSGKIHDTEHQTLKFADIYSLDELDWADADEPIVEAILDSLPKQISERVNFNYLKNKPNNSNKSDVKRGNEDYIASAKVKLKAGDDAELAVINYEKDRLNNSGRPDLADKIRQVSKESASYGYDILSYEIIDKEVVEKHIEVKSSKLSGEYIEFFLSQNELDKFKNDELHRIYCLFRSGRNYKLHEVSKKDFLAGDYITPYTYRVRIRVSN